MIAITVKSNIVCEIRTGFVHGSVHQDKEHSVGFCFSERFNSDCALYCGCMVLCRSLLFLPKKPTPTSLLLGKLKNTFTLLLEKDAQCVFCDFSLMETVRHSELGC
jgi:hypothetical protein